MRHPWFKFYPSDWRGDPKLRACSAVSRLLWLEMFCLSHEAEPYGYVLVSGHAPTPAQLAAIAGLTVRQVTASLAELEAAGVFSRNELGVIYSRRMVRDRATAERRAAGGGKSLEHPHVPRPSGEPEGILEGIHQGRPQIPDTRSQRTTTTLPARASEAERLVRVSLPVADYVQAFERLLRSAAKPDSLAASVRGFGPGGIHECASWDELGHALMDLAATPGTATPAALKAFIRRIQAGDPPLRQHGTPRLTQREKSLAVLDAALAREDAA